MEMQMKLPAFRELAPERRAIQRAWLVSRIARRPPRSRTLVLAALFAILVAAPALALQRDVVDFFSSEPAPERIQLDFDSLRKHVAEMNAELGSPKFTPVGPAREVMRVHIDGEMRPLWVVPTEEGTFCYRLHFGLSCLTPENAKHVGPIGGGGLMKGQDGMDWIDGRVANEAVQAVELLYQDGERVKLPFVWVSAPVDEGFYAYDIPAEHEEPGRLAVAVVGLDEDREPLAHFCLLRNPEELARSVPAAAKLCERAN